MENSANIVSTGNGTLLTVFCPTDRNTSEFCGCQSTNTSLFTTLLCNSKGNRQICLHKSVKLCLQFNLNAILVDKCDTLTMIPEFGVQSVQQAFDRIRKLQNTTQTVPVKFYKDRALITWNMDKPGFSISEKQLTTTEGKTNFTSSLLIFVITTQSLGLTWNINYNCSTIRSHFAGMVLPLFLMRFIHTDCVSILCPVRLESHAKHAMRCCTAAIAAS